MTKTKLRPSQELQKLLEFNNLDPEVWPIFTQILISEKWNDLIQPLLPAKIQAGLKEINIEKRNYYTDWVMKRYLINLEFKDYLLIVSVHANTSGRPSLASVNIDYGDSNIIQRYKDFQQEFEAELAAKDSDNN